MSARALIACLLVLGMGGPAAAEKAAREDQPRVRARVESLSRGEGSLGDFRIELMEGGMASHTSYEIGGGKIVMRAWAHPGGPERHTEKPVGDAEVRELLRQLIDKEYWMLEGTKFTPDATTFIMRLWDGARYADYHCDLQELWQSPHRAAVRQLLLDFAAGTPVAP